MLTYGDQVIQGKNPKLLEFFRTVIEGIITNIDPHFNYKINIDDQRPDNRQPGYDIRFGPGQQPAHYIQTLCGMAMGIISIVNPELTYTLDANRVIMRANGANGSDRIERAIMNLGGALDRLPMTEDSKIAAKAQFEALQQQKRSPSSEISRY